MCDQIRYQETDITPLKLAFNKYFDRKGRMRYTFLSVHKPVSLITHQINVCPYLYMQV